MASECKLPPELENYRHPDEKETSILLGVPVGTLRNWRGDPKRRGEGPPYVKFGRSVRYCLGDLLTFAKARRVDIREDA